MERDFEVIRKLLDEVAEKQPVKPSEKQLRVSLEDENEYHNAYLLYEEGYLAGPPGQEYFKPYQPLHIDRLTWAGEDLRAMLKDEGVWEQTKKHLSKIGGRASLEVVKYFATEAAKNLGNLV